MIIDQIIRFVYYFLFIATPLVMSSKTSELFEFNKMILIYIASVLIATLWLIKMVIQKKIVFKRTYLDIPILIFLTTQVVSTIFSIDLHTSIFGYYGRFNGGLLSIIAYLILFYGFVSNFAAGLNKEKILNNFLKLSLLSSFFVILWGLPGRVGHDMSCLLFTGQFDNSCWTDQFRPAERMFSTLGQPNWLGSFLAINFFIGVYFLFKRKETGGSDGKDYIMGIPKQIRDGKKMLVILYLFANFSSVLFTRSRSALGALIAGVFLFVIYYFFTSKLRKFLIIFVLTLLLPVILFKTGVVKIDRYLSPTFYLKTNVTNNVKSQSESLNNFQTLTENVTDSLNIRKIVWQGALELGKKYPLFGTGVETFAYSYYFARPVVHNLTSEWDFLYNKAHNEFLNYFATTGYSGLISYLLMILVVIVLAIKNWNNEPVKSADNKLWLFCLFLSYLTILITNFFGFATTTINLYFYLIPGFIVLISGTENSKTETVKNFNIKAFQKVFISLTVLLGLFSLIYLARYYLADIKYAEASNYIKASEFQIAAVQLQEAIKLRSDHVYEDKLSTALANLSLIASAQKEDDISKRLIALAEYYNRKSLQGSPKNILYLKTGAKNEFIFYQITNDKKYIDTAIATINFSEKISPTDPKLPYSLAVFYSILYDEGKSAKEKNQFQKLSLAAIDESIRLKPNFRDGYLLKGQLLKKYGQKSEAESVLKFILEKINPKDDEVKKELQEL